jgi:hypothetical protein
VAGGSTGSDRGAEAFAAFQRDAGDLRDSEDGGFRMDVAVYPDQGDRRDGGGRSGPKP